MKRTRRFDPKISVDGPTTGPGNRSPTGDPLRLVARRRLVKLEKILFSQYHFEPSLLEFDSHWNTFSGNHVPLFFRLSISPRLHFVRPLVEVYVGSGLRSMGTPGFRGDGMGTKIFGYLTEDTDLD